MKRNIRSLTTSATHAYVCENNGIRKITIIGGADASLAPNEEFVALCYGGTTLYAATKDTVYTVNTTTGVLTLVARISGIDTMAYVAVDSLFITTGNSGMTLVPSTGVSAYVSQEL